jgi:hypothetical protein
MSQHSSVGDQEGLRPTSEEARCLTVAYNFFYDIFDEVFEDSFWTQSPYYRFSRIRDAFLIYSEVLEYEPIGWIINVIKKVRPPMEAEISKDLMLFIRNVLIHFPFFKQWEEVEIDRKIINWSKPGQSIDKFLETFSGHSEVKYRTWNPKKREMTYASIHFPIKYDDDSKIRLKDVLSEKEGIKFCLSFMRSILNSQVADESEQTETGQLGS